MTDENPFPGLKKCRPSNLDSAPPGENQPNYPSEHPQYSYNFENDTHKILIMVADGHHGPDRWKLDQNELGTTEHPQHEHDDLKRLPPTILQDSEPKDSRVGYLANYRLPDARPVYDLIAGGDEMGLPPSDRARKPRDRMDDGS